MEDNLIYFLMEDTSMIFQMEDFYVNKRQHHFFSNEVTLNNPVKGRQPQCKIKDNAIKLKQWLLHRSG